MKTAQDTPIKSLTSVEIEAIPPVAILEDLNYINAFSTNENSIKIIFDPIHLKIISISKHVEPFLGYTPNEILQIDIPSIMNCLRVENSASPAMLFRWLNYFRTKLAASQCADFKMSCCGLQIKHKQGHSMRILLRYALLDSCSKTAVITINNISHLMQAPFYWGSIYWEHRQYHFSSKNNKLQPQTILSGREKETLHLLAQGFSSFEIAGQLFISPHTVDHHRRNMIARTGLRDTTALLQVMHMTGVV